MGCAGVDAGASDAQTLPDASGACVYPDLHGEMSPTPGSCDGDVARNCDRGTGVVTAAPCGEGDRCVEVDVHQVAIPGADPAIPEHRYRWAVCVPRDSAACGWSFGDLGSWLPDEPARCDGTAALSLCAMGLPDDFPENAGTPMGYRQTLACRGDEHCRDARCVLGDTPCDEERWACEGDTSVVGCAIGELPARTVCPASAPCRSTTACTAGAPSASCIPSDLLGAGTCTPDPDTVRAIGCSPGGGQIVCSTAGVCWGESECVCAPFELGCLGPGTTCQAFVDPDTGATDYECRSSVSCTAGSRCEGDTAIRCDDRGRPAVLDCAGVGMTCAAAGSVVGCAFGTEACTGEMRECTRDGEVLGCCGTGAAFHDGAREIPCVPGRMVQASCPVIPGAPPYRCFDGFCTAG